MRVKINGKNKLNLKYRTIILKLTKANARNASHVDVALNIH
jgi:hypothetical protein